MWSLLSLNPFLNSKKTLQTWCGIPVGLLGFTTQLPALSSMMKPILGVYILLSSSSSSLMLLLRRNWSMSFFKKDVSLDSIQMHSLTCSRLHVPLLACRVEAAGSALLSGMPVSCLQATGFARMPWIKEPGLGHA